MTTGWHSEGGGLDSTLIQHTGAPWSSIWEAISPGHCPHLPFGPLSARYGGVPCRQEDRGRIAIWPWMLQMQSMGFCSARGVRGQLMGGRWAAEVKAEHAPRKLGPPDVTGWEQGAAGRSWMAPGWWVWARLHGWLCVPDAPPQRT